MTRVRSSIVGALMVAGLAAATVRAQDPPAHPSAPAPGMPGSPEAEHRGPIRSFFYKFLHSSKTPRSGHSDWSTGRDDKLSKPWLQPPSSH